jgi:adenosylcobyric acid synthase
MYVRRKQSLAGRPFTGSAMTLMEPGGPLQWMVIGTGPAAAKTCLTIGLSGLLRDRGIAVAPFKSIAVIHRGVLPAAIDRTHPAPGAFHQIGAIGLAPEAIMNPVAVWQTSEQQGEIVVMGEPAGTVDLLNRDAIRFDRLSPRQRTMIGEAVRAAYDELRRRFEAIVIEGAGSPVEAPENEDWANLRVMRMSRAPTLLVGRLSNGGAAAALIGTLACLGPEFRRQVIGLVLSDATDDDAARHAISLAAQHAETPMLGVIPQLHHGIDGSDARDYGIAYRAWTDALAAHLDLGVLGPPFAEPA